MDRIFQFEHEGTPVLGFDTGLDVQAFAQAKIAQFITQNGYIVYPDGKIEAWYARGVIEQNTGARGGTMIVWGPAFPGERFDLFISGKEEASVRLDGLRFWIHARMLLEEARSEPGSRTGELSQECAPPYPWPSGAFYVSAPSQTYPRGCLFFPPERLLKRCIEVDGVGAWIDGAEQWVHPDLEGEAAAAFAAGTMLYRILCGTPPFQSRDFDTLREDIREGVFLPPHLACPGLAEEIALILNETLIVKNETPSGKHTGAGRGITAAATASFSRNNRTDNPDGPNPAVLAGDGGKADRERLRKLAALLGDAGSKSVDSFIRSQNDEERFRLKAEKARYIKTSTRKVNAKRFLRRNRTAITVTLGAVLLAALISGSIIKSRMELPTTKGMTGEDVVRTYYEAFGTLDHTLMQACVINKAGKGDIDMITNLFVMSRVRMAYETTGVQVIPAQQWIDEDSPSTENMIFGVSGLNITELSGGESEIRCRVSYTLWAPAHYFQGSDERPPEENPAEREPAQMPVGIPYTDEVTLTFYRDAWRISAIARRTG